MASEATAPSLGIDFGKARFGESSAWFIDKHRRIATAVKPIANQVFAEPTLPA
jgi:hypothetical protein